MAFDADKVSIEGKAIVSEIHKYNSVPFDTTLAFRVKYLPKDYPLTRLREKLAIDELTELTKHNDPIVRCFSFKALTQRDESAAFLVVKHHLQDTTKVSAYRGCFGGIEFVGDYFVGVFQGREAISHDTTHLYTLDSLLIFIPNKLKSRSDAIKRAGEKGKYYSRIKENCNQRKVSQSCDCPCLF
jgi:hypothetical protein